MQRMVVLLEDYNEVVDYAPEWAIEKWDLYNPEILALYWQPHWWPWRKSHGRWISHVVGKSHD